jgi:archaellum component FlaF (FlaF/FlaG flagellin family)
MGTPVAYKGGDDAYVNVTIVNVGAATISVSKTSVLLNAIETTVSLHVASYGASDTNFVLEPGKTSTLVFKFTDKWDDIKDKEFINAVLTIEGVGSQVITIRVLRVT